MRLKCVLWYLILAMLAFVIPAGGQTIGVTTGAINGRVSDESGAVLPGVTVSVTGAAQMGVRTGLTDEQGVYRVPGVATQAGLGVGDAGCEGERRAEHCRGLRAADQRGR